MDTQKPQDELAAIDRETERLLQELAVRESYYLLEGLFNTMEARNMRFLLMASDDKDRLYCQAYAKVVDELRRRFQKYRPQTQKDKPIVVSANPPMNTKE